MDLQKLLDTLLSKFNFVTGEKLELVQSYLQCSIMGATYGFLGRDTKDVEHKKALISAFIELEFTKDEYEQFKSTLQEFNVANLKEMACRN